MAAAEIYRNCFGNGFKKNLNINEIKGDYHERKNN